MLVAKVFSFLLSLYIILAAVGPFPCSSSYILAELCITYWNEFCPGGNQSLSTGTILVYYNHTREESDAENSLPFLLDNEPVVLEPFVTSITCISLNLSQTDQHQVILIEQLEHGGGQCNCLNVTISLNGSEISCLPLLAEENFCGGLASHPRRVLLDLIYWNILLDDGNFDMQLDECEYREVKEFEMLGSQFNRGCTNTGKDILSKINISFSILFNESVDCDTIDSFDEGIEFSVRFLSSNNEWIPLAFIYYNDTVDDNIDRNNSWNSRGYQDVKLVPVNSINEAVNVDIFINNCTFSNSFQFRWIQTSVLQQESPFTTYDVPDISEPIEEAGNSSRVHTSNVTDNPNIDEEIGNLNEIRQMLELDLWSLNNITITYSVAGSVQLTSIDPKLSLRNSNYSTFCIDEEDFKYTFGGESNSHLNSSGDFISSRLAITPWYNTARGGSAVFINKLPKGNVNALVEKIRSGKDFDSSEIVIMLISAIRMDRSIEENFDPELVEESFQKAVDSTITFLQIIDNLLFNYFPVNKSISFMKMALHKFEVNITEINQHYNIHLNSKEGGGQNVSVSLPSNLLTMFAEDSSSINITSALYHDFNSVFSQYLTLRNQSSLVSDIVSASLQCGSTSCNTSDLLLKSNVTIKFEHSMSLKQNKSFEVVCAFLQIQKRTNIYINNSLPYTGQWLTKGCSKDEILSSEFQTVCSCNHLTHFALLLSPKPPVFSRPHRLSLRIIGYIGVGISVLAMAATVLVFSFLKSQHNLRNYIHVHLCISLAVAQIIFVAGVDKVGQQNNLTGIIPIHCQVIAVLLHYFFLVSFMWMLMEGVFLYLALVRVFITNTKKYLLAFTVVSYGLPLLYMGLITLPLGFALKEKHYGYITACFLNHDSHFIWAFLAPVVIIFLCNIALLLMAGIILWKQQREKHIIKKFHKISKWLKAIVSLTIVMGLTWIVGLFVLETEELLPLAYIYTIMVAFQGVFIFLVLVIFTQPVWDKLSQWKKFISNYNKKMEAAKIDTNSTIILNAMFTVKDVSPKHNIKQTQASLEKKCTVKIYFNETHR